MPTRVVHCKKEKYDEYIGRPSKLGNPFSHKSGTLAKFQVDTIEEAVEAFEQWVRGVPDLMAYIKTLKGKTLGCWCKPGICHGDVIARIAEEQC